MNKDTTHTIVRNEVESLLNVGYTIEQIAKRLNIELGTRFMKGTAKWYKQCVISKQNQKKAIQYHPNLYSRAGKIAQQKHPWIAKELGKKYGPIYGKINAEKLKGNSAYFRAIAKKLHRMYPEHSRKNMEKAHTTMKEKGTFYKHQKEAALKCMNKHPTQLKNMSKKAHANYPLALLSLESRRRNYPYKFMDCQFDSEEEMRLCQIFVERDIIERPLEGKNIHFKIGKCHIDFFLRGKIFVEYHPPRSFGRKIETSDSYYIERRELLDNNGYANYPIIIVERLKEAEDKLNKIKSLL